MKDNECNNVLKVTKVLMDNETFLWLNGQKPSVGLLTVLTQNVVFRSKNYLFNYNYLIHGYSFKIIN